MQKIALLLFSVVAAGSTAASPTRAAAEYTLTVNDRLEEELFALRTSNAITARELIAAEPEIKQALRNHAKKKVWISAGLSFLGCAIGVGAGLAAEAIVESVGDRYARRHRMRYGRQVGRQVVRDVVAAGGTRQEMIDLTQATMERGIAEAAQRLDQDGVIPETTNPHLKAAIQVGMRVYETKRWVRPLTAVLVGFFGVLGLNWLTHKLYSKPQILLKLIPTSHGADRSVVVTVT